MNLKNKMINLRNNPIIIDFLVILFFFLFIIGLLNSFLFMPIHFEADTYFHVSRMYALQGSWTSFLYPQNFASLAQVGMATNLFYPSFIMAVLANIIPTSIGVASSFKIFVILIGVVSATSLYLLMKYVLKRSIYLSFLISLLWSSFVVTFDLSTIGGETLAKLSFPFIAVGLIKFTEKYGWLLLSFGLIISFSTHILTAAFLCVFVGVYLLILLFTEGKITKHYVGNVIKSVLFTFLGSFYVIFPIMVVQSANTVMTPYQPLGVFLFYNTLNATAILNNPTFVVIISFAILSIVLTKRIGIGLGLSFFFMILGTSAVVWPYVLQDTPLNVLQFPYRIFNWSVFFCFLFSAINISKLKYSVDWNKVFFVSVIVISFFIASNIRSFAYYPRDSEGHIKITSLEEIIGSYQKQEDGYRLTDFGAFGNKAFKTNEVWMLMNYADYAPLDSLVNKTSKFLFWDPQGSRIAKHEIQVGQDEYISTKDWSTDKKRITFGLTQSVSKKHIKLPVLGYRKMSVSVLVNGKIVPHEITDGQISIDEKISTSDTISVVQKVPLWRLYSFIVSLISWFIMLTISVWYYFGRKNKH